MADPKTDTSRRFPEISRSEWLWGLLLLLAFTVAQSAYAIQLNRLYYATYGPFYDSLAYLDRLATVIDLTKTEGVFRALTYTFTGATVFLPFGFVPFFGSFVTPAREIAIALQSVWVLLFTGTTAYYLRRCRGAEPAVAVALSILFVSIQAIYHWHGGLSDFRMDLQFYLLYSTTVVGLLIALQLRTVRAWVFFGFVGGLCCLGRGIAPAYLALTCIPMVIFELFAGRTRAISMLKGVAIGAGVCIVTSGWFYYGNWQTLHYYYFIWNTDANLNRPIAESVQHFGFAWDNAGGLILGAAGLCTALALLGRRAETSPDQPAGATGWRGWLREVEWRALAPALVPVGYLTLSGSGPNQYVSMPSAFGAVLFLLSLAGTWKIAPWARRGIVAVTLGAAGLSATTGIPQHWQVSGGKTGMAGFAEVSRAITEQAPHCPFGEVNVSCFTLGAYHNAALQSYLIYDRHLAGRDGVFTFGDKKIVLYGPPVFQPATRIEWELIPGATDEERVEHVVRTINQTADLVVLPTPETAESLGILLRANYVNRFTVRIRQRLLETGKWNQVSNLFAASPTEQYTVFRNGTR